MQATLALGSAADVAAALLFAFTGWRIAARHVSAGSRLANAGLAAWWLSIALIWLLDGARGVAVLALGTSDPRVVDAATDLYYAYLLLLCVALWGLLTYLAFLIRGRSLAGGLALFYGAYFAVAAYAVSVARPARVEVTAWSTYVAYAQPLAPSAEVSLLLFLLVPQVVGVVAYLSLARRVDGPLARYRVLVVGTALLVWIGLNLVADVLGVHHTAWWEVGRRVLALVASLVVLAGYHPPRWVVRRYQGGEATPS